MNLLLFDINVLRLFRDLPAGAFRGTFDRDVRRGHFFSQLGGGERGSNLNKLTFPGFFRGDSGDAQKVNLFRFDPFLYNFRMPANLPPEYHRIEAELRTARTPEEKIDIYERLIRVIPHHKGTDKLIAMYRQKIAKAREEGERRASTAKHAPTHKIEKSGAGQVVLAGPPNAGKSSLVQALTGVAVEIAEYPFTTRSPAPFMMPFENVKVQLVDTPPVTGELMETWFPEMVKMADAVLLVADLTDPDTAPAIEGIVGRLAERKVELVPADTDVPSPYFPFRKRAALAANKIDVAGAPRAFEDLGVLLERSLRAHSRLGRLRPGPGNAAPDRFRPAPRRPRLQQGPRQEGREGLAVRAPDRQHRDGHGQGRPQGFRREAAVRPRLERRRPRRPAGHPRLRPRRRGRRRAPHLSPAYLRKSRTGSSLRSMTVMNRSWAMSSMISGVTRLRSSRVL